MLILRLAGGLLRIHVLVPRRGRRRHADFLSVFGTACLGALARLGRVRPRVVCSSICLSFLSGVSSRIIRGHDVVCCGILILRLAPERNRIEYRPSLALGAHNPHRLFEPPAASAHCSTLAHGRPMGKL